MTNEISKKRLKIMVGVNTLTTIDQPVYSNHCQFWYRLGRSYSDCDFAFYTPRRSSIDRMRNEIAKLAIIHDFDYLLFVDDDVLVPFDGLAKLMKSGADIAAGHTIIRGWPFDNMFFKYSDESKTSLERYNDPVVNEKGLIICDAVGFSFCLLKVSILKQVPAPFFVTGPFNTEDVYFCIKAKSVIPELTIIVDPTVKTGHSLGGEYIDPDNREAYKEYFAKIYPDQTEEKPKITDRGDDYVKSIEADEND